MKEKIEEKKIEKSVEIQKYEIDKKFEIQQQKLDEATTVVIGKFNLTAISMLAEKFSKSGEMIPKEFRDSPEKCFAAIYKGATLGLDAFTSLQRISVVNGRATIWGDTALALVRSSGLLESFEETLEDKEGKLKAICSVKRNNEKLHISEFSQEDATKAGLWGKGVWASYPKRMLKYRARAFALRDIFADVLDGLYLKEEMDDPEVFNKKIKVISNSKADSKTEILTNDEDLEALNQAQFNLFQKK